MAITVPVTLYLQISWRNDPPPLPVSAARAPTLRPGTGALTLLVVVDSLAPVYISGIPGVETALGSK